MSHEVPSFEQKLGKEFPTETLEVLGGEVQFTEAVPEKEKTEIPSVLVPGWGTTPKVWTDTLHVLKDRGRHTYAMINSHENEELPAEEKFREYPEEELRGALALLEFMEKNGLNKTDVIAQSEGAIKAAIAASIDPEKFRNIIFSNPAGMIGKDNFPKLLGRFGVNTIKDNVQILFDNDIVKVNHGICMSATVF